MCIGYIILIAILYFLITLLTIFAIILSERIDDHKLSNRLLILFGSLFWPITWFGLMCYAVINNLFLIIVNFFKWLIKGPNN